MRMRWRCFSFIAHLISIIALWTTCNGNSDVFSCFLLYSNRYLERSGAVFIKNLSSTSECLERCLQANRLNFLECRSVMWRRDTNDCVLSRHRRSDRIESFHVAPNLEIDFYENICLSNDQNRVARRVNETKTIEKSFENDEWTKDRRTTIPIKEIDERILKHNTDQIFVAASNFLSSTPDPNSLVSVFGTRKRAKVFASTQSIPFHPITLNDDISGQTTIDSVPISNDFPGNRRPSRVEASPIRPLVTNPLNRTVFQAKIDSPIASDRFYQNSKEPIPLSSVESFHSRADALAVSGDTIPSKASPIRLNVNSHAHVFRRNQIELPRNVRGSVILIPANGANPSPPTIAPAITTNSVKPIRPGPVTRHYYKPNTPFTTPTPLLSTQVVIDSEQEIDAEPLVVLNGQKRPSSIVSSGFRATITPLTPTAPSITTRSTSFPPTIISRNPPSGKELSDAPCFLKYSHRALPNYEEKALNGVTLRDCLVTCLYTSDLYCASVNYDFNRKICIVNGGSSSQTKTALQMSKTIDYYENVCPPAQPRTPDELIIPGFIISRCLTPIMNTMLEDLDASLVKSAQTLEECQSECLRGRARRGKVCGGMNWIQATNGCMIFTPQYDRQQLSFAKDAIFFINSCTEETFDGAKREKTKNDYYEDFAQ